MSIKKYYISERFFTKEELQLFEETHKGKITEISYASYFEIDFSDKEEKDFLMKKGYPMIQARFYS